MRVALAQERQLRAIIEEELIRRHCNEQQQQQAAAAAAALQQQQLLTLQQHQNQHHLLAPMYAKLPVPSAAGAGQQGGPSKSLEVIVEAIRHLEGDQLFVDTASAQSALRQAGLLGPAIPSTIATAESLFNAAAHMAHRPM